MPAAVLPLPLPFLLLLLLFLFLLIPPPHHACRLHHHCDDNHPSTVDLCIPSTSRCLHYYPSSPPLTARQLSTPPPARQLAAQLNLSTLLSRANSPPLPLPDRARVITTMSTIFTHLNPNRPLQLTRHNTNITALLAALLASPALPSLTNTQFHHALRRLTTTMRDRHSRYILPAPLAATVAILGFAVAPFFPSPPPTPAHPPPPPRYLVNSVAVGFPFANPAFGPAAEILTWDNRPIHSVVRRLSRATYGANPPARLALATIALAFRELAVDPLPSRPGAHIVFRAPDGRRHRLFVPWVYLDVRDLTTLRTATRPHTVPMPALAPPVSPPLQSRWSHHGAVLCARRAARVWGSVRVAAGARVALPVAPLLRPFVQAEIVGTRAGRVGRIAFSLFALQPSAAVVGELRAILAAMPRRGLIVDIRNNRGGSADFVKVLTEMTTGGEVDAQPTTIRANAFTRRLLFGGGGGAEDTRTLRGLLAVQYRSAVRTAVRAGEEFAGPGVDLYSAAVAGRRERRAYFGPVVTLVNGVTYSAGDLYTAIQKDKRLSTVVGTDANVGAGGAAGVAYQVLALAYEDVLEQLPGGIDFTTAFLRFYRSGPNVGGLIESFGVVPDVRYFPSRRDALEGDCDLMEFLGKGLVEGFGEGEGEGEGDGVGGRRRRR